MRTFSIFLDISLPLVFYIAQKTVLQKKKKKKKKTQRKMKEGSMPDEQIKSVLKNSASATFRITVHYLHFALISVETKILW